MPTQVHVVLLAPFLLLALWVIWRAVTVPSWIRRSAVCGNCGYEFTGAPRCPECGRDVEVGGVATRRLALHLRGSLPAAAIALLLIVVTFGVLAASWANQVLSRTSYVQFAGALSLVPTAADSPLISIELSKDGLASGSKVHSGAITILMNPSKSSSVPSPAGTVQIPSGGARVTDGDKRTLSSGRHFDRPVAEALFEAAGLDMSDPAR